KVNAAICAQIMLSSFGVGEIINTGVAGGIVKGIRQNDIIIAERFVQHDVDTTAIGDPIGFVSTINKVYFDTDKGITSRLKAAIGNKARTTIGTIATGDQCIADKKTVKKIHERFNASACDMEGGAIAQVCALADIPFGAVRCISDSADEKAHMDYPEFAAKAAATCAAMVMEYFRYFQG
ncbi:MAG: 5'-methylthioadenosine/adenosylhomocysteine nucleosidase, partial [Clostridia bacterium]|nr:5'-methylthioadenosine/adenosylhomocysteine nucleosidase [Clostridia bacterium]